MGLLVPSPGRPLEACGNARPRWMAVQGAQAPEQNPAYQPARSPSATTAATTSAPTGSPVGADAREDQAWKPTAARAAAPMMPELLRCTAGTVGVLSESSGRKSSAFLETPPPMTKRSGLKSTSR